MIIFSTLYMTKYALLPLLAVAEGCGVMNEWAESEMVAID